MVVVPDYRGFRIEVVAQFVRPGVECRRPYPPDAHGHDESRAPRRAHAHAVAVLRCSVVLLRSLPNAPKRLLERRHR
jgi:hypothetical protein